MMSDQEITSVIRELSEAIDIQSRGGFIPGLMGILEDAEQALTQLQAEKKVGKSSEEALSNLGQKMEDEIILIHGVSGSSGVTTCCGKTVFELPLDDKITLTSFEVNCGVDS